MSDFGDGATLVAVKKHDCAWCHTPIEPKEKYYRFKGKWDGEWQNWAMHSECHDVVEPGEICDGIHKRGKAHDENCG